MSFLDQFEREPWRFDFYDVMRRFERLYPDRPRIGDSGNRRDDLLTLGQNPYLEFPPSTITGADRDAHGRHRIMVRFLGMFGPQGALPLAVTEEAWRWWREGDDAFARFVDIFHNRFLQAFYRAWADARPWAQHDRPANDRFETYIGAQIGLGSPAYRDRDALHDGLKLRFAGLLAARTKSAHRLATFLDGVFGLRVEIEQFSGAWLELDEQDRTRLGWENAGLGQSVILGRRVYSIDDRIVIRLFAADLAQYEQFLPGGVEAARFEAAVVSYLGDEFLWTVELVLPAAEAPPMQLGRFGRLGWTMWMAPAAKHDTPPRRDARFDPVAHRGAVKTSSAPKEATRR